MKTKLSTEKFAHILHGNSTPKHYTDSSEGWLFAEKHLKEAKPLTSDAEVLRFGSDAAHLEGLYVELGFCTGKTTNFIAALNPHKTIYGFDSLQGLPEDWVKGNETLKKGAFQFNENLPLPAFLKNVELIIGWFEHTLPEFTKRFDPKVPISFIHIDCDLYSSTKTAFSLLGDRIQPGTILVFDELYNYPGYENHEYKALQEFLTEKSLKAQYLAYNKYHEQVTLKIL